MPFVCCWDGSSYTLPDASHLTQTPCRLRSFFGLMSIPTRTSRNAMDIPSLGLIERKGDDGGTGTADAQQGFPVCYAVSSCLSAISFPRETRHPKAGGVAHG
ncbi:hypothetical protein ABZX51_011017 [Aspergillus tubingensis]